MVCLNSSAVGIRFVVSVFAFTFSFFFFLAGHGSPWGPDHHTPALPLLSAHLALISNQQ